MSSRFEVVWAEVAIRDLEEIVDFVEREAPMAAGKLFDRIVEHSRALETFPLRGRVIPELARFEVESYRELILPPYRLMFRIEAQKVFVIGVFDGRRNLEDVVLSRLAFQSGS